MRLAILALSAAAISGCSWLGGAGHPGAHNVACNPVAGGGYGYGYQKTSYGYAQGAGCGVGYHGGYSSMAAQGGANYGANPYTAQYGQAQYGQTAQGYQASGYAAGHAGGQGYVASGYNGAGYGAQAYAQGYNAQTYTAGTYGGGSTTLGSAAPYGAALSSQYSGASQYGGAGGYGQTSSVQTVVGAPLYVNQPYPVPLPAGSPCCGGGSGGGAMPFGVEVFGGVEYDFSGDIFTRKPVGPPDGDYSIGTQVGGIDPIGYDQAFGSTANIGVAMTYDLSPATTLVGSITKGSASGRTVSGYTTVQPGTWDASNTFTPDPGTSPRALDGTFSDLETTSLEAGVRHYVGMPQDFRPYVGVSAGFQHNNDVTFTQTYSDDGSVYGQREFIREGWTPTASATFGAELALSRRAAIGVESGIRWRDAMPTTGPSKDRLSMPVTMRGRLSF